MIALITKEVVDLCDVPKCLFPTVARGVCVSHVGFAPLADPHRKRLLAFCASGEMPRYIRQLWPEKDLVEQLQIRILLQEVALGRVWIDPSMASLALAFLCAWEAKR